MRASFLFAAIMFCVPLYAQRGFEFNLMPELSGYANLNKWDVSREKATNVLQSSFAVGGGLGIAFRLDQRKSFFFLMPSLGYRMDPQKLTVRYDEGVSDVQKITNVYLYIKPVFGVSIPVGKNDGIDIGTGVNLNYALKSATTPYSLRYQEYTDVTGEVLRRPVTGYYVDWGDHRENSTAVIPSVVQLIIQTAYISRSILPNGKPLRLGLEFATRLGKEEYTGAGNEAQAELLDKDRNVTSAERYWDHYTSLGISLGIGL